MQDLEYNQKLESEAYQKKIKVRLIIGNILLLIINILFSIGLYMAIFLGSSYDKPIIYLYPEEETEVSVKVVYENLLTHTYPKYKSEGWKVVAKPNGDLEDLDTGRYLYSLYYEAKDNSNLDMSEGFVVKGEDTIPFLEEKLEQLGLNQKEAQEFIIYWLPKLESNKYNFIKFLTTEDLDKSMPLEVSPKPDTNIRILMQFKGLDRAVEVEEQKIETPERRGFVLVEWGGTEF